MDTLNRDRLSAAVHAQLPEVFKSHCDKAVDIIMDAIVEQLSKGGEVQIRGLGTLKVVDRKARTAQNLHTGQRVQVPAKRKVKFVAGKILRERLAALAAI